MAFREYDFFGTNSRGAHRIVYSDWGPEDGKPLICVHGLTGNGHDFDVLAPALVQDGYRVIAVDLPGRGRSDFLLDPLDYNYTQYCKDLLGLIEHIFHDRHPERSEGSLAYPSWKDPSAAPRDDGFKVDWLGVSLGGLLGIRMAGEKNSPIKKLILNDIGPEVPKPALDFIHMVISQTYTFDTIGDLEKRMRATRGLTWGPVTDEQWRHMAEHNARALEDGSITYSYDPGIAAIFETEPTGDTDLWPCWDRIDIPVFLIHGKKSVVLTRDIIAQMKSRGPGESMDMISFGDCGHVPSLMADEHIRVMRQWMNNT